MRCLRIHHCLELLFFCRKLSCLYVKRQHHAQPVLGNINWAGTHDMDYGFLQRLWQSFLGILWVQYSFRLSQELLRLPLDAILEGLSGSLLIAFMLSLIL